MVSKVTALEAGEDSEVCNAIILKFDTYQVTIQGEVSGE